MLATDLNDTDDEAGGVDQELYPADLFVKGITQTTSLSVEKYKEIVEAIHTTYEAINETVAANHQERGRFVGCLLRNAGHDFMDFRRGLSPAWEQAGSDGCMDYRDADNTGLEECLKDFGIPDLYKTFRDTVSLADFFVIIAEAASGRTATGWSASKRWVPESLEHRYLTSFKYGRKTRTKCGFVRGRMPNPEHGCEGRGAKKDGLEQIFVDNIFAGEEFAWTLTAAISGAHTVGSAKLKNSGYHGHWSSAEQQGKFNNDYFKRIVMRSWAPETNVDGNGEKNQWQLADTEGITDHKEMMLTTDLCLAYAYTPHRRTCEEEMREKAAKYCKSTRNVCFGRYSTHSFACRYLFESVGPDAPREERDRAEGYQDLDPTKHHCCSWIAPMTLMAHGVFDATSGYYDGGREPQKRRQEQHHEQWPEFQVCGIDMVSKNLTLQHKSPDREKIKKSCCHRFDLKGHSTLPGEETEKLDRDCDNQYAGRGHAYFDVLDFAREEFLFYKWYVKAWNIATENGAGSPLKCLNAGCDAARSALTEKETQECPGDAMAWKMNPPAQDMKEFPSCGYNRIGDTKVIFPDSGLHTVVNWYKLTREAIPLELRQQGYNGWNIENYFEIPYVSASASSNDSLDFDGQKTLMPPSNLIKVSTWKEDLRDGKIWNRKNDHPWTIQNRGSTCWASSKEKNPWVALKFKQTETVYKVILNGLHKNRLAKETLEGARVWVRDSGGTKRWCGKLVEVRDEPKEYPNTVVCKKPVTGDELVIDLEGEDKQLILCMAWSFRYDEKHHVLISQRWI